MPFRLSLLALVLVLTAIPGRAQEAWLVTYGPGAAVEERFGHNAIWIRDSDRGVDRIYNFGFFDFDQEGFYTDYAMGRMVYFAAAQPPAAEFEHYRARDRSIRTQRLNLPADRIVALYRVLERAVHPEHRDFRYDYFFNNCSNRVRDVLDGALDGALERAAAGRPAEQNFRGHTRRLIEQAPFLYLGIHAGLGRLADAPRTVWDEMFLPEVVAREVSGLEIPGPDGAPVPLVSGETWLYQSRRFNPPTRPGNAWGVFALAGVASAVLILLPLWAGTRPGAWRLAPLRIWLALSFLAGAVLLFLWLVTEHQAAWRNENLLLLNPLLLGLWSGRRSAPARVCAAGVMAGLVAALALKAFPHAQWNYDLMLWLIPAQVAAVGAWWRSGSIR